MSTPLQVCFFFLMLENDIFGNSVDKPPPIKVLMFKRANINRFHYLGIKSNDD